MSNGSNYCNVCLMPPSAATCHRAGCPENGRQSQGASEMSKDPVITTLEAMGCRVEKAPK